MNATATRDTITVDGRVHAVDNVRLVAEVDPQLATHMKARGFDAYGFVRIPSGEAIAYRLAGGGSWCIVQRVRR